MRGDPLYGSELYFDEDPTIPSRPQELNLHLKDFSARLKTDRGVFSYTGFDAGTKVLLEVAPDPTIPGDILDLGCGYGIVAVVLAHRYPNRTVWAIDVNRRALALTQENVDSLGLKNVKVCTPEEVPIAQAFSTIYSNPPVRVGKGSMRELLILWLKRLLPGGSAYFVVKKNLGADSLTKWLNESGWPTERFKSRRGYRVLRVLSDHLA